MGRILAIDYGTKRSGIAVSDPLRIISSPLDTVATHTLFAYLEDYIKKNEVDSIVIGLPIDDRGLETDATKVCQNAFIKLTKKFPSIHVVQADERYTSKIAQQSIQQLQLTKKKRQAKWLVDKVAAAIILQDYLAKKLKQQ